MQTKHSRCNVCPLDSSLCNAVHWCAVQCCGMLCNVVHCCAVGIPLCSVLCTAVHCSVHPNSAFLSGNWMLCSPIPLTRFYQFNPVFLQNSSLVAPPQIGTFSVLATFLTQSSHLVRLCVECCSTCMFIVITHFSSTFLNFPQPDVAFNGEFAQFTEVLGVLPFQDSELWT